MEVRDTIFKHCSHCGRSMGNVRKNLCVPCRKIKQKYEFLPTWKKLDDDVFAETHTHVNNKQGDSKKCIICGKGPNLPRNARVDVLSLEGNKTETYCIQCWRKEITGRTWG